MKKYEDPKVDVIHFKEGVFAAGPYFTSGDLGRNESTGNVEHSGPIETVEDPNAEPD